MFRSRNLSIATKVRVFQSLVVSDLLYGAETWPMNQQNSRKLFKGYFRVHSAGQEKE